MDSVYFIESEIHKQGCHILHINDGSVLNTPSILIKIEYNSWALLYYVWGTEKGNILYIRIVKL